ncbi:hypothetical protein G7046_g8564 [Stylonectria norvegica]|nr:hypothetical protein G7046_g8564 [Stylonectria norvegica]
MGFRSQVFLILEPSSGPQYNAFSLYSVPTSAFVLALFLTASVSGDSGDAACIMLSFQAAGAYPMQPLSRMAREQFAASGHHTERCGGLQRIPEPRFRCNDGFPRPRRARRSQTKPEAARRSLSSLGLPRALWLGFQTWSCRTGKDKSHGSSIPEVFSRWERGGASALCFFTELRGVKYPIRVIIDWASCTICGSPRSHHHSGLGETSDWPADEGTKPPMQ